MASTPSEFLDAVRIALLDLDAADVQDIRRGLRDSPVSLTPEEVPGDRYGEPGTIVLAVVLVQPVIHALAAWILKNRRKQSFVVRTRLTLKDGSEIEQEIRMEVTESQTEPEVANQLVNKLGIDPTTLLANNSDDN